jgi:hypothetical protein
VKSVSFIAAGPHFRWGCWLTCYAPPWRVRARASCSLHHDSAGADSRQVSAIQRRLGPCLLSRRGPVLSCLNDFHVLRRHCGAGDHLRL